ncbi:MAG: molybdate ABC transporter substrate-binding protein [Gammaproteobacteria bacterium]|nr:molybdate ABC transporter substrate-binding protein [Gammaproteobacteria bacterium]
MNRLGTVLIAAAVWTVSVSAHGADVLVACAANFTPTLERIATRFESETRHSVRISTGSTGTLYAKIRNGAPYDIFLAADIERPRRLEREGTAVAGTRFTYAIGRLVLWAPGQQAVGPATLSRARPHRLAIANPKTAPYGRAARETLRALGMWEALAPRIVRGENVAQAFQYVASGAAPMGFVALSQVRQHEGAGNAYWIVPQDRHTRLEQQAVVLEPGRANAGARALWAFLRGETARTIIAEAGYDAP